MVRSSNNNRVNIFIGKQILVFPVGFYRKAGTLHPYGVHFPLSSFYSSLNMKIKGVAYSCHCNIKVLLLKPILQRSVIPPAFNIQGMHKTHCIR